MRPVPWLSGCLAAVLVLASVEQVRSQVLPTPVDEAESVEAGLINIESDSQSADNVTGVVTASGNVRIEYPLEGCDSNITASAVLQPRRAHRSEWRR